MKKLKVIAILLAITTLTNVHAVLQSRDGVAALNASASTYFKKSREMEATGGILGLNATMAENATTGAYEETSTSNNIDSHMCKNTEWGAAAMLSASTYGIGNGGVRSNYNTTTHTYGMSASTTGNMSGVFGMYKGPSRMEYMAAGILTASYGKQYLAKAAVRYVDSYEANDDCSKFSGYIPGDATYETKSFGAAGCFVSTKHYSIFARGNSGVFSSGDHSSTGSAGDFHGTGSSWYTSRACIWVGEGI